MHERNEGVYRFGAVCLLCWVCLLCRDQFGLCCLLDYSSCSYTSGWIEYASWRPVGSYTRNVPGKRGWAATQAKSDYLPKLVRFMRQCCAEAKILDNHHYMEGAADHIPERHVSKTTQKVPTVI